jgi:formylmethanofuran--tetrahydromethanopterin N-formyltransferase
MGIVEDTYAEGSYAFFTRVLVTAERGIYPEDRYSPDLWKDPLRFAAYRSTATPAAVVGWPEAGIEGIIPVPATETPDGREGAILQFWGMINKEEPLEKQIEKFYRKFSIKVRQDILSVDTTRLFNWLEPGEGIDIIGNIDTQRFVGDCGRGYERHFKNYGDHKLTEVHLMGGEDFVIDEKFNVGKGVCSNFWILCYSTYAKKLAGRMAIESIQKVKGVITPFYICPSGSMPGNYKEIGPPTNFRYVPSLKDRIRECSLVPNGVKAIPEIVINGISKEAVTEAMRAGILAASKVEGVHSISAGNYNGEVGELKFHLREIVSELFG